MDLLTLVSLLILVLARRAHRTLRALTCDDRGTMAVNAALILGVLAGAIVWTF